MFDLPYIPHLPVDQIAGLPKGTRLYCTVIEFCRIVASCGSGPSILIPTEFPVATIRLSITTGFTDDSDRHWLFVAVQLMEFPVMETCPTYEQ